MKLRDSIRTQFVLMIHKRGFQFSFLIVLVYCLLSYINNVIITMQKDISLAYSADSLFALNSSVNYWNIFCVLFPYIIVFPFAFTYIEDKSLKNDPFIIHRFGKKNYLVGKMMVCFLGGFLIIFIPFMVNLFLCQLTFPHNLNNFFGTYYTSEYWDNLIGLNVTVNTRQKGLPFLQLYLYSPFFYNIFYLFLCSVFSGVMGMFALATSIIIKKQKILLFVPPFLFIYIGNILDAFSFESGAYTNFNWMEYISIDDFYGKNYGMFFGVLIIMIFYCISSLIYVYKKEDL